MNISGFACILSFYFSHTVSLALPLCFVLYIVLPTLAIHVQIDFTCSNALPNGLSPSSSTYNPQSAFPGPQPCRYKSDAADPNYFTAVPRLRRHIRLRNRGPLHQPPGICALNGSGDRSTITEALYWYQYPLDSSDSRWYVSCCDLIFSFLPIRHPLLCREMTAGNTKHVGSD